LLHDDAQRTYILRVSQGLKGIKIPQEFARMDYDNSLIRLFKEHKSKEFLNDGFILYNQAKRSLRRRLSQKTKEMIRNTINQMDMIEAVACVPSFFQDDLLGILFLGKKKNGKKFHRKELDFFVALSSDVAMAIYNARLFKQLQNELYKRQELFIHTTIALAAAIEAKDRYTHGHTNRVTNLSLEIGKRLIEIKAAPSEDKFLEHLQIAALLHDIGKIGIAESILNKNGPLTDEERKTMEQHPIIGASILQPINELEAAIKGVKYHHERYDGKGYPEGLKNNHIPLIAAIIAVADTFDAIITNRPYRGAMDKEKAMSEIQRLSGQQFNPEVVCVFLRLWEEGKI
ncbi:MAG: HD-GYP domain-containing protein, partial [Candidatus Omnitrophota bacterium]